MKTKYLPFLLILISFPLFSQEQGMGMPGDNLNLYGVLNIFQRSRTLSEFERFLNLPESRVNNLDLNADGFIDYIHIFDNRNGAIHNIVLRVNINEVETQDVAVIEVDRDFNNQVHLQIVGDEALYGRDYIVEPNQNELPTWPIVGHLYEPVYVVYESPYHWGNYPTYYQTVSPVSYTEYYSRPRPYEGYYNRSNVYRLPEAHSYYAPHRVSSPVFREKYHANQYHPNNEPVREHNQGTHQEQQRVEQQRVQPQRMEQQRVEPQRVQPQRAEQQRVQPQRVEQQRVQQQRVQPQRVQPQRVEQQRVEPQPVNRATPVTSQPRNQVNQQPTKTVVHPQPAKSKDNKKK